MIILNEIDHISWLIDQNHYEDALERISELIPKDEFLVREFEIQIVQKKGEKKRGVKLSKEILEKVREMKNPKLELRYMILALTSLQQDSQHEKAEKMMKDLDLIINTLSENEQKTLQTEIAMYMIKKAWTYVTTNKDEMIRFAHEGAKLIKGKEDLTRIEKSRDHRSSRRL